VRDLALREHQTSAAVPLDLDQVEALRAALKSLVVTPSLGRPGHYDLTPGSEVGALEFAGLHLVIRPKVDIDRILFLLAYSSAPGLWRPRDAWLSQREELLEAVVDCFVYLVGSIVRSGLFHGYQSREEALQGVRGRILMADQVRRRFGRFPPAEVRYDEFTPDVAENQILRAALVRLGRLRIRSRDSRRNLRTLTDAFAEVSAVRFRPGGTPEMAYTRLNERYRTAVELARRILDSTSFDLGSASVRARGFLVDMNRLFEDFVVTALREALGVGTESFPRGCLRKRLSLDDRGLVRLEPDLSWWREGRCVFVGDVKYRRETAGDNRGRHSDLYQLLAYVVAADLPGGVLVYAAGEVEPGTHRVRYLDRTLEVHALDLSRAPEDLLAQAGLLARRIRELAKDVTAARALR
jgi:5-methylcytosine-specific restriction enzyme subunit McrC